jgi:hypothetical protein
LDANVIAALDNLKGFVMDGLVSDLGTGLDADAIFDVATTLVNLKADTRLGLVKELGAALATVA